MDEPTVFGSEQKVDQWNLSSVAANFGAGWFQGLTTLDPFPIDAPDTMPEFIARSFGSVLGFVGFGPASLTKMSLTGVGRVAGWLGKATVASEYAAKASRIAPRLKSVPMAFAEPIAERATKAVFESSAMRTAMDFTKAIAKKPELVTLGQKEFAQTMFKEATLLGMASAIGARPLLSYNILSAEDLEERWKAGKTGAFFGVGQSAIANAFSKKAFEKIGFTGFDKYMKDKPESANYLLKSMRAVSLGLGMASISSFYRDEPIEYNIYEGLLNGVFGWREMPYNMKRAHEIIKRHIKNSNDPVDMINYESAKGDPVSWFREQKKEVFSEDTANEIRIATEAMFGNRIKVDEANKEAIINVILYRNPTMDRKQFDELPPIDKAALVYDINKGAGIRWLGIETRQQMFNNIYKTKIDEWHKTHGEELTEAQDAIISEDALNEAGSDFYRNFEGIAEHMKEAASKIQVKNEYNIMTEQQLTSIMDSFKESGVSFQGMMEVIKDMSIPLKENSLDVVSSVQIIGRIFKNNRELQDKGATFKSVQEDLTKALKFVPDQKSLDKLNTLWLSYANSVAVDESYYDVNSKTTKPNSQFNKDGTRAFERRGTMPYEDFFNTKLHEIKTAFGKVKRGGKKEGQIGLYDSWQIKIWDKAKNKYVYQTHSININELIHAEYANNRLIVGGKKADAHILTESIDNLTYDSDSDTFTYKNKKMGLEATLNIRQTLADIERAEIEAGNIKAEDNGIYQKMYTTERTKYIDDITKSKDPVLREKIGYEYDINMANLMLKTKLFDRQESLYEMFSHKGFSIRSAFADNKRNQVKFDVGVRMQLPDGRKELIGIVIKHDKNDPWIQKWMLSAHEAWNDGVLIINRNSSLKKGLQNISGMPNETAFHKFTIADYPFIGKLGGHVATEKMQEEFFNKPEFAGLDYIVYTTGAKQVGKASVSKMTLDSSGKHWLFNGNRIDAGYTQEDVIEVTGMTTEGGAPVGARVGLDTGKIYVDRPLLRQKYNEKAWLRPHLQRDNTTAIPLAPDQFKSYEEFERFAILHEKAHLKLGVKTLEETYGAYESRTNDQALIDLASENAELAEKTKLNEEYFKTLTHKVRASSLRVNPGVKENMEEIHSHLMKQLMEHAGEDPALYHHFYKKYVEPSILGNEWHNARFSELDSNPEIDYDQVDIKKVSGQLILDTLYKEAFTMGGRRFKKVAEELLSYQLRKGDELDEQGGENEEINSIMERKTYADLVIAMVGKDGLQPIHLMMPGIREYVEQIAFKYIKERAQRPIIDNSFHSKGVFMMDYVTMRDFLQDFGVETLTKGTIILGDQRRNQPIKLPKELRPLFGGKRDSTLGEMWDKYKETNNSLLDDWFSRIVVGRSPQSDISGNRRMKLLGFAKGGGWGIGMHGVDLNYLDGADMDGDSYAIYMGFDKMFSDYISKPEIKHYFSKWVNRQDKTKTMTIKDVLANPPLSDLLTKDNAEWEEYFAPPARENQLIMDDKNYSHLKTPFSLFDPAMILTANRLASVGRDNLGPGITATLRGSTLNTILKQTGPQTVSFTDAEGKDHQFKIGHRADPFEKKATKTDIVNRSADSADGFPMKDADTIRAVGVLSAVDIFDSNGQLITDINKKKELIHALINAPSDRTSGQERGLKNIPFIKDLMSIDSALRSVDYDGKPKNLQDMLYELRDAADGIKSIPVVENGKIVPNKQVELSSIWYDTARLLGNLKYEPNGTEFINIKSYKVASEMFNAWVKKAFRWYDKNTKEWKWKGDPIVGYLLESMGRRGISFNRSSIKDTATWTLVKAYLNKQSAIDETKLLSEWIKAEDFRETKLWSLIENLPVGGKNEDMSTQALSELVDLMLTRGDTDNAVIYHKDKVSVEYTHPKQPDTIKRMLFDTEEEAQEWLSDNAMYGINGKILHDRMKTQAEKTKTRQDFLINDIMDINSFFFMHDSIMGYASEKLGKEATDEDMTVLLDKKIRPIMEKITVLRRKLEDTRKGVYSAIQARDKKEAFASYEDVLDEIQVEKEKLEDHNDKLLFESAFISSMHFNEYMPDFEKMVKADLEAHPDKLLNYADKAEEQTAINNMVEEAKSEWRSAKFKTMRGRTPFLLGVASPSVLKAYFKKLNDVVYTMKGDPDGLIAKKLYHDFYLSSDTGYLPNVIANKADVKEINEQPITRSKVRQILSPFKRFLLESTGNDGKGNPRGVDAKDRYNKLTARLTEMWIKKPAELDELDLMFPVWMNKIYGSHVQWTIDNATARDIELYLDALETGKLPNEGVPSVLKRFFFQKFKRVAPLVDKWQKAGTETKLTYPRHVLTREIDEEGNSKMVPVENMQVMETLGHFGMLRMLGDALITEKNIIEEGRVNPYFKNILLMIDKLDRDYNGAGTKIMEAMVATIVEEPFRHNKIKVKDEDGTWTEELSDGAKLFEANYQIHSKRLKDVREAHAKDGFSVVEESGNMKKMSVDDVLTRFIAYKRDFQKWLKTELKDRPDDSLIVYTGESYGKIGRKEVDTKATLQAMMAFYLRNGRLPDMSLRARTVLAQDIMLQNRTFDFFETPHGIVFKDTLGEKGRVEMQRKLEASKGSITQVLKQYKQMTLREKNALIDDYYKNNVIEGLKDDGYDQYDINYHHHIVYSRKVKEEFLRAQFARALEGKNQSLLSELSYDVLKLVRSTTRDIDDPSGAAELVANIWSKDSTESYKITPSILKARNNDNPIPGWSLNVDADMVAMRQMLKQKYEMQYIMLSKYFTDDIENRQLFGENSKHLAKFGERFIRQTLGLLDTLPAGVEEGYSYGMKTNVFKGWSDSYWAQKIQDIGDTWFGGKIMSDNVQIEKAASLIAQKDRDAWIKQAKKIRAEQKISWLSQMEAKWSLLSLLTSFKSYVTNISSATVMTYINAGHDAFMRSMSLKKIQEELGSENIQSWSDVSRMVAEIGSVEGFLSNFAGLTGDSTLQKFGSTLTEVMKELRAKGNYKDTDIRDIIRKHGMYDVILKNASWFMRASEHKARERSMLAHYINARRVFRQSGFELEVNDPWLLQIAREGTNTAQFLYSNAERPPFMATGVGKIFHRFQIFAYNSVEFRLNVSNAAKSVGINIGSESGEKFKRMMVADLFVFGLAGMMPYTMFGAMLPPPYNYLQSMLNFTFGDDKKKKGAFYGAFEGPLAPLNQLTPPGMREIPQLFSIAYSRDMDEAGNFIASWMPFARIAKDTYKSLKNPSMTIDNMTGIPLVQIPQYMKESQKMKDIYDYIHSYKSPSSSEMKTNTIDIQSYIDRMSMDQPLFR